MKLKAIICAPLLVVACSNESVGPTGSSASQFSSSPTASDNARLKDRPNKNSPKSADSIAVDEQESRSSTNDVITEAPTEASIGPLPDEAAIEEIITRDAIRNNSPNVIYARIDHLARKGGDQNDLEIVRFGMTKVLNSVSMAPAIVPLKALDTTKLVFRINFSELRQNRAASLVKTAELAASNVSTVGSATVVKGDWLVFALSRPETYDRILGLPPLGTMIEAQLGVDVSKAVQINTGKSEVVFKGRVLERIPLELGGKPGGYYWRSFDFVRDDIMENAFVDPSTLRSTSISDLVAGEIFYSLPNGLQAYYLVGFGNQHRFDVPAPGKSIDPGVATDFRRPQDGVRPCVEGKAKCGIVINGESCMTCHGDGVRLPTDPVGANGATVEQVMNLIQQDRARFAQAIREMNFPQVSVEPIFASLLIFKKDRGFADVREQAGEVEAIFGR